MPKVPTLAGPSVDARPLPTPYASADATPEAFGAGVADAVGDASQVAFNVYHRARQQADLALVQKQEAALREHANLSLWGENGLHKQEGENALRASTGLYDTFEKRRAELESGLTDQKQKDAFNVAATNIRDTFRSQAEGWIAHQRQVLGQQSLKGTLATTKATIANGFTDPRTVDEGMTAIESNLRAYGAAHGVPSVETDALVAKEQGEAARTIIYGHLAPGREDAVGAQAAYAQFKDRLGYLPENERHVLESAIRVAYDRQQISSRTLQLFAASSDPVDVPGVGKVARVNGAKLATALSDLPPDTPHLAEIVKATETERGRHKAIWTDAAGTVAERVHSAGYDPASGVFDIDSARISAQDKAFLQQNAPGEWDKLVALDQRVARMNSADTRAASKDALAGLDMSLNDPANREHYLGMSATEFNSQARALNLLPADLISASDRYRKFVEGANKNLETPSATVARMIKGAIPNNQVEQKRLYEPTLDAVTKWREQWMQATGGKAPKLGELQDFISAEIATGKVKGTGFFLDDRTRRVLYEKAAGYRGKTFEPLNQETPAIPQPPVSAPPEAAPSTSPSYTTPSGTPVPPLPTSIPMREPLYRYTPDRKRRVPVDSSGKAIGPIEAVE